MFAPKSALFVALFVTSAQLAVAAPPACLLAAVKCEFQFQSGWNDCLHPHSTESNPANLPLLCGADSSKVQTQIKKLCGANTNAALTSYKETCGSVGKTVCMSNLNTLTCHERIWALLTPHQL